MGFRNVGRWFDMIGVEVIVEVAAAIAMDVATVEERKGVGGWEDGCKVSGGGRIGARREDWAGGMNCSMGGFDGAHAGGRGEGWDRRGRFWERGETGE